MIRYLVKCLISREAKMQSKKCKKYKEVIRNSILFIFGLFLMVLLIEVNGIELVEANSDGQNQIVQVEDLGVVLSEEVVEVKEVKIVEEEPIKELHRERYTDVQLRLNEEIYNMSASVFNEEHVIKCYGSVETNLGVSFVRNLDPLVPMALCLCETGTWNDTRYTWAPAIYSKAISSRGVNMDRVHIEEVDYHFYVVNGLTLYLNCGSNCAASKNEHNHTGDGKNDNDSLGPAQVLRRYVESNGCIKYDCGATCEDLMSWEDNLEYIFHDQCNAFSKYNHWNKDYELKSVYESVMLMATIHNTGSGFMNTNSGLSSGGSTWKNAEAPFKFARDITTGPAMDYIRAYIEEWYETEVLPNQAKGTAFIMPGQMGSNVLSNIMKEAGLSESDYSTKWGHKQNYPLKALLNYMALEKLYNDIQ